MRLGLCAFYKHVCVYACIYACSIVYLVYLICMNVWMYISVNMMLANQTENRLYIAKSTFNLKYHQHIKFRKSTFEKDIAIS